MGLNFVTGSKVTASKSELRQTNFTASLSEEKSHEGDRGEREGVKVKWERVKDKRKKD